MDAQGLFYQANAGKRMKTALAEPSDVRRWVAQQLGNPSGQPRRPCGGRARRPGIPDDLPGGRQTRPGSRDGVSSSRETRPGNRDALATAGEGIGSLRTGDFPAVRGGWASQGTQKTGKGGGRHAACQQDPGLLTSAPAASLAGGLTHRVRLGGRLWPVIRRRSGKRAAMP